MQLALWGDQKPQRSGVQWRKKRRFAPTSVASHRPSSALHALWVSPSHFKFRSARGTSAPNSGEGLPCRAGRKRERTTHLRGKTANRSQHRTQLPHHLPLEPTPLLAPHRNLHLPHAPIRKHSVRRPQRPHRSRTSTPRSHPAPLSPATMHPSAACCLCAACCAVYCASLRLCCRSCGSVVAAAHARYQLRCVARPNLRSPPPRRTPSDACGCREGSGNAPVTCGRGGGEAVVRGEEGWMGGWVDG